MDKGRTEKIGSVTLDYTRYPGEDFYCDGAIEDELLNIVQNVPAKKYPEVIYEKRSWEVLYHLSDLRENIVEWLPMDKGMKVLEVGSGCGAITGSFARKAGSVTCVDLSRKRSLINAYRHKECDNVTIHVGNFQDIEPDLPCDYDYVCLVGVFEYGQSYIGGQTPFTDFYKIVKKHVKPGGRVVIAIENKMGLKYWAGCREDHLGSFFSGLEDYPEGGVVRTFTKGGLEKILKECGESEIHFYYPYPDYKFMTMVYSDRYLPRVGELSNNLRNFDRDRMLLFDEKKVFDMLIRENLFPLYSNSYLVVTGPQPETAYSRFSNDRAGRFCIRTDIGTDFFGKKYVRKFPANEEAAGHVRTLAQNYRIFEARFAGSTLRVNRLEEKKTAEGLPFVELEFLEDAVTLEELLDSCLQREDEAGFFALFERYLQVLSWNSEGQLQDFDLIFPNICVQGDTWTMIDYEWTTEELAPEQIARRALYCYVLENKKRADSPILQKVLKQTGLDEDAFAALHEQEVLFQENVMRQEDGSLRTAITDMRHRIGNMAVPAQEFFARADRKKVQIFEDFGGGYSPADSYYIHDAYLADDWIRAQIVCRPGTKGIRLDPAEVPCIVRIKEVTYGGKRLTTKQLLQAVVTNGEALGDGAAAAGGNGESADSGMTSVLFDTNDPNINVRLDQLEGFTEAQASVSGPQAQVSASELRALEKRAQALDKKGTELVIEAEISWLSDKMLADLKSRIARRKHRWFQK